MQMPLSPEWSSIPVAKCGNAKKAKGSRPIDQMPNHGAITTIVVRTLHPSANM
jgi:hypothetical protein